MRFTSLVCCLVLVSVAVPARAETRVATFPTAFRPNTLNTIAPSRTAPVVFVGSRDTDTVFAVDPRTGEQVGQLEVPDGPLALELFETAERRLLAITCDGFLGAAPNRITIVDATNPAAMRLERAIEIPPTYIFFLGYRTLRFLDASTLFMTITSEETARALLVAYDVASGAELGRVDVGFVPGSLEIGTVEGRRIAAVGQSVAPRGRVTLVDVTDPSALHVTTVVKLPRKSGLYNVNNVAIGGDGRTGFVATGDGDAMFAFDLGTGRVLSKVVTGSFPTFVRAFDIDGSPRVLVVGENAASASVYDVSDPEHPTLAAHFQSNAVFLDVEPALSADGRTAFLGTTAHDRVYAIDLVTGDLRYQRPTGRRPIAAATWEGGGERYVCIAAASSFEMTSFRDDQSGFFERRFGGPDEAIFFTLYQNVLLSPDGRYAYVASKRTDELLVLDVATASVVGRIGVCDAPSQIALAEEPSSGRGRVAVLGTVDSAMTIVDATNPAALAVAGTVDIGSPFPFYLEFANVVVTADGRTAFVVDGNQFVHAVDLVEARIVGTTGAGFVPVTLALREDRGQRRLAVLNAMTGAPSVTILDVSNPAQMSVLVTAELPEDLIVALNNVPQFTADGRFVLVGASLSEALYSIEVETGRVAGRVERTSATVPAPYVEGGLQRFAAANLGKDPSHLYRLRRSGAPREAATIDALEGTFSLVGNNPVVAPNGSWGLTPNYGRASLVAFDPTTGAVTGEVPLGKGPGVVAIDSATGVVVAIEINGSASRLLFANVADAGPLAPRREAARAARAKGSTGAVAAGAAGGETPRVAAYSTETKSIRVWERRSNQKSK